MNTNICNWLLVICGGLLAFNAYLLIEHKSSAKDAIAHLSAMNADNLEAHADLMAGCE